MEELELVRKKCWKDFWKALGIGSIVIIVGLSIISIYAFDEEGEGFIALMSCAIILVLAFILFMKARSTYNNAYKNLFIKGEMGKIFQGVQFDQDGHSKEDVYGANLLKMGNRFYANDKISGEYEGIHFSKSDIHIQQVTGSGKNRRVVTYFKGQWLTLSPVEKHTQAIYVIHKRVQNTKSGWFSSNQLDKVDMESIDFNNTFDMYAQDDHEAFYVMKPQKIEDFLNFEIPLGVYRIGTTAHIGLLTNKDSLEPSFFRKVNQKDYDAIKKDAEYIKKVIRLCTEAEYR